MSFLAPVLHLSMKRHTCVFAGSGRGDRAHQKVPDGEPGQAERAACAARTGRLRKDLAPRESLQLRE